jgi:acyl carrier protein
MTVPTRNDPEPRPILARYLEEQLLIEFGGEIGPDTDLFEAGVLDSFGLIELVKFIEKEFAISIEDEEIASPALASLAGMTALVERKRELDLA